MSANFYVNMAVLSALRYERKLNGVGVASFTLPADDARAALIHKHTWFEIFRCPDLTTTQHEGTYMVVLRDRFVDDDGVEWSGTGLLTMTAWNGSSCPGPAWSTCSSSGS